MLLAFKIVKDASQTQINTACNCRIFLCNLLTCLQTKQEFLQPSDHFMLSISIKSHFVILSYVLPFFKSYSCIRLRDSFCTCWFI